MPTLALPNIFADIAQCSVLNAQLQGLCNDVQCEKNPAPKNNERFQVEDPRVLRRSLVVCMAERS